MFRGLPAWLLCFVVAAVSLLSSPAIAQVQIDQQFIPLGPAPSVGPLDTVGSGDLAGGTAGTVTGAVEAILLHPLLGRDTMFIGSTNGGIWRTTNGGKTWTPVSDNAHSLSIGSLDIDVTDRTGKTLIAGVGVTSSGNWAPIDFGTRPTGVLYSTDGGQNWEPLGMKDLGSQSVVGVAARGDTILAATFEQRDPALFDANGSSYGLYISTDRGKNFQLVESSSGLPSGPITSLVADPSSPKRFYAAVTSLTGPDAGVYVTNDSGKHWKKLFDASTQLAGGAPNVISTASNQLVLEVAAGKNGSVAIGVIDNEGPKMQSLTALYLLPKKGDEWSSLAVPLPPKISEKRPSGVSHSALMIDPKDTSAVYWAGWEIEGSPTNPTTVAAFRIQGNTITSLTCPLSCSGSVGTTHADPRSFAIDADGNLLLVGDGGVYKRTNPQGDGVWSGLNTTLQVHEPYQVGYGANAHRLVVDAQDTGVAVQCVPNSKNPNCAPDSSRYSALQGADGHAAVVSDKTFPDQSVYYTSSQTLSDFARLVLDADGKSPAGTTPLPGGVPITCNGGQDCSQETGMAPMEIGNVSVALNAIDPKLIALTSGLNVYVAEDGAVIDDTSVDLTLTDLGYGKAPPPSGPSFRALAYGASDNPFELLAGGEGPHGLYRSTFANPGNPATVPLTQIMTYDGGVPTSLAFGPFSEAFYVADSDNLYSTQDDAQHFAIESLSGSEITNPTSVEFINHNGVQALLVGGLKSTAEGPSPIAVADSDANGNLSGWRPFGQGMPNVLAYTMSYNRFADVLAVGGVGRGVWTLFDVTSYFRHATTLQFGLADNDSKPSAHYLTDGMRLDGTAFVRALKKYGKGILTIAGEASYTGGTTIWDGALQLGSGGTSGSIRGDVSFCSDATDPHCNPGMDKVLAFNRSDTYTFGGVISGPGQLMQNGIGTTVLTGASTYTGPTWVNRGALFVNGSITSPVIVYNGGVLGGTGRVGATTVGYGGTFAPGNSIGTMTVNGAFTLTPGAIYEVEVNAAGQNDKVIVNGTVNLTGATLKVLAATGNYKPATSYTIIDNDGNDAVTGAFATLTNNLVFLDPSVLYDGGGGNDVVLTLTRNATLFQDVAETKNQRAVAGALDRFPTGNGLYLAVANQTASGARQAFDALSGEIHASVAGTLADDSRYTREAVLSRLMQASHAQGSDEHMALAAGGPQVAALYDGKSLVDVPPERAPLAFWTQGFGAWADFDSDGNAASAERDLGGFISGMDADIGGTWRAGLATGATFSNVDVSGRNSAADVETYHLGGYVGGMVGAFALRGGGLWAWNSIDTSRAVVFPGFFERQNASYDPDTGQLFGEIAYPTQMGGIALEPFGGIAFVSIDTDNFRERGGPLASLRGVDVDQDIGYTTLGLRAATTMQWGATQVTPHISAAWQHAFDDVTPGASLAFASTGIGFSIAGVPLAEDAALLDAGLDFALGENGTAGVSYSGQFGNGVTDNAVKGRFTWLF